jgi:arsenate reductase
VCDDAAENCPLWLGKGQTVHIGFQDPAAVAGTEVERLEVFCRVRDGLRAKVVNYLDFV